jgi:hypothetical protein
MAYPNDGILQRAFALPMESQICYKILRMLVNEAVAGCLVVLFRIDVCIIPIDQDVGLGASECNW